MQLTAVDVTGVQGVLGPPTRFTCWAGGPGPASLPEELAGWWGTITYEVFCLLGAQPAGVYLEMYSVRRRAVAAPPDC